MNSRFCLLLLGAIFYFSSCDSTSTEGNANPINSEQSSSTTSFDASDPLMKELPHSETGVLFNNELDINTLKSPIDYINVYNGGGMGIGDINNDGLQDLYFTGNQVDNKLYLNKGNFQFEDITERAGVACAGAWSTGVTMSDVNGDGFLDMYVCQSYYEDPAKRKNQLFINNGDLTFTEKSKEMGLESTDYSITATFFDYDRDGNPDLFLGNHPLERSSRTYLEHIKRWKAPTLELSDRLYHNNGDGTFTEVTEQSGLLSYGWTLGVVSADLNQDNWPDLFLSIDHTEPDRYYMNNQDGTFTEVSEEYLKHMSHSSMGVDAADINNDGLLDLAVVEMLAVSNFDEKTKMNSMNPERFWAFVDNNYNYQYMRNMMHLGGGKGQFSEIGQMAGVERTNWSWASLLADFDNDGWKDFYVSNGYFRNYTDKDHHKDFEKGFEKAVQAGIPKSELRLEYGKKAPSTKRENNFFRNNGDLTFTEMGPEFGLDFLGFSSGAAYADLDNDGDLDLVVNNIQDIASIYKNQSRERGGNNYLRVNLNHSNAVFPVGTKVTIETDAGIQYQEFAYVRGYQSSVEGTIHFGLGKADKVNKLSVWWPDGKGQELTDVAANQELTLNHADARNVEEQGSNEAPALFAEVTENIGLNHKHEETIIDDYAKQILLPHKMSQFGPFFTSGDVNKDGLEDFYVGGGNGQPGALYVQKADGTFEKAENASFITDQNCEDMGAAFVDVNNDGFIDLYVASGGNEFGEGSAQLQDRLYINVGNNELRKVNNAIPDAKNSSSCVKPFDFDGDGDMDLFVGGRQMPGKYPSPANSMLLENVKGKFVDATPQKAPGLQGLGMVTDAAWTDFDGDGVTDLVIVGEWMPITVFKQTAGNFENATTQFGLENTGGWWNRIAQGDLDNDGDTDFILGNLGLNYKYSASPEKPFHVYASDFDESGTFDIALGYFLESDVLYPVRGRQCSSEQVPVIAEKFPTYSDYGKASIFEVYGDELETALHYEVTEFKSSVLLNKGAGNYELLALPNAAQIAPVNGIVIKDFDQDGNLDALVAGNLYVSEVETGRADAGKGLFLKGQGNGEFIPATASQSGLDISGDVKDIYLINAGKAGKELILIGNNNEAMEVVKWIGGHGQQLTSLQ